MRPSVFLESGRLAALVFSSLDWCSFSLIRSSRDLISRFLICVYAPVSLWMTAESVLRFARSEAGWCVQKWSNRQSQARCRLVCAIW